MVTEPSDVTQVENIVRNDEVRVKIFPNNLKNNNSNRGFNRLTEMGMSSQEVQVFRVLFHAMYLRQHRGG